MIKEITITVLPEDEKNKAFLETACFKELKKNGISADRNDTVFVFVKKSIDARHGQLKLHLRYKAYIGETPADARTSELPVWKKADGSRKIIIIGAGPAGLFGALTLLEYGITPIIIERGDETSGRRKDIAKISTAGIVNPDSNYCFGEGGAGTFSDGKLYTRSNKRGNITRILQIFTKFGANPDILTDAHPHIGTEKLPTVINAMKEFIIEMGGEFHFHTKCIGFLLDGTKKVTGITAKNVITGEQSEFKADSVILATGHSASDIYTLIAGICPEALEAKTFAIGVRVEHPRKLIDSIQYHGKTEGMSAAEYRLTTQAEGRGVYSFCMCPG
ncbi:MAG: FAD-dependent oxidoreductase, partial [Treponema porcinum]